MQLHLHASRTTDLFWLKEQCHLQLWWHDQKKIPFWMITCGSWHSACFRVWGFFLLLWTFTYVWAATVSIMTLLETDDNMRLKVLIGVASSHKCCTSKIWLLYPFQCSICEVLNNQQKQWSRWTAYRVSKCFSSWNTLRLNVNACDRLDESMSV